MPGDKFKKYISENHWPEHFPRNPDIHFAEEFESWPEFLGYKQLSSHLSHWNRKKALKIYSCPIQIMESHYFSELYVKSWIEVLKEDKTAIFRASSLAQKATEFILNFKKEG